VDRTGLSTFVKHEFLWRISRRAFRSYSFLASKRFSAELPPSPLPAFVSWPSGETIQGCGGGVMVGSEGWGSV
jgi:hypothetical protein